MLRLDDTMTAGQEAWEEELAVELSKHGGEWERYCNGLIEQHKRYAVRCGITLKRMCAFFCLIGVLLGFCLGTLFGILYSQ